MPSHIIYGHAWSNTSPLCETIPRKVTKLYPLFGMQPRISLLPHVTQAGDTLHNSYCMAGVEASHTGSHCTARCGNTAEHQPNKLYPVCRLGKAWCHSYRRSKQRAHRQIAPFCKAALTPKPSLHCAMPLLWILASAWSKAD